MQPDIADFFADAKEPILVLDARLPLHSMAIMLLFGCKVMISSYFLLILIFLFKTTFAPAILAAEARGRVWAFARRGSTE